MGTTAREEIGLLRVIATTGSQKLPGTGTVIDSIELCSKRKVGKFALCGSVKSKVLRPKEN